MAEEETTSLLGREAANLSTTELTALRQGIVQEIGEAGAVALEEGLQIGGIVGGTASYFCGITSGLVAGGLIGVGVLLVIGSIILIANLTQDPSVVPSLDGGHTLNPTLTKFANMIKGKLVWVFCHLPGDPNPAPKWWKGIITGHSSAYLASDVAGTYELTVFTKVYYNNTLYTTVKVRNMLNIIEQLQGPPPNMRPNFMMWDKDTEQGLAAHWNP
jgi:hypothetical protein